MGRVLQKKKNRSSIPKVRQKQKSKKKILQNPIIAANWNQKETLSQNYRRLGLTARLHHSTGGTEKTIKLLGLDDPSKAAKISSTPDTFNITSLNTSRGKLAEPQEAQVEYDSEGKIVRIIHDPTAVPKKDNPLNDPLNELSDEEYEEWNGFAMVPEEKSDNPVIRQLEEAAANGVRKAPRKQSTREEEWIERLVEKYGDNYGKMFRDRKLNPMQQSEGDLKRRITKWKKSHGRAA